MMNKISSRLIALAFISIIFVFGGLTSWHAKGKVLKVLKSESWLECEQDIEDAITDKFSRRNDWINLNGLFQHAIGTTIIRDSGDIDVYKLSNGQLTYAYPDKSDEMEYDASAVKAFSDYVTEQGKSFIYVQLPCKVDRDGLMPPGTTSYAYSNADDLLNRLDEEGVHTLDLREKIVDAGFDNSSLFFNTDHHWKPSTALWAASQIASELANSVAGYSYDASIYDSDSYTTRTYKDWFLGSLGRRTGIYFGGTDDFDVILPAFDTDFELYTESQTNGKPKHRSGSFNEALMKLSNIEKKDYFSEKTYFTYLGSEYRTSVVTNKKAPNNCRILLLRDSFSCTLLPYLSLSSASVTAVDLRYHGSLDLHELIDSNDFDAVVIAYNPSMFREEGAFDFW